MGYSQVTHRPDLSRAPSTVAIARVLPPCPEVSTLICAAALHHLRKMHAVVCPLWGTRRFLLCSLPSHLLLHAVTLTIWAPAAMWAQLQPSGSAQTPAKAFAQKGHAVSLVQRWLAEGMRVTQGNATRGYDPGC